MSRVSVVAQLHKAIRDGYFDEVHTLILSSPALLWKRNTIGWTALHCCASHGTPDMDWWRWVLTRAIYERRTCLLQCKVETNKEETKESEQQLKNLYRHTEICGRSTYSAETIEKDVGSFLHTRIDFYGHSVIDLFFARHLHPLSWQRSGIHQDAKLLKDAIQYILQNKATRAYDCVVCNDECRGDEDLQLLELIRRKITSFQRKERQRQMIRKLTFDDDVSTNRSIPIWTNHDDFWTRKDVLRTRTTDRETCTVHDQRQHQIIDIVVNFWSQMELLLMAAHWNTLDFNMFDLPGEEKEHNNTYNMKGSTDKNLQLLHMHQHHQKQQRKRKKWRVIHALASTHCPKDVAQLGLALYPHQAMERDEDGYLPLHIAAASPSCTVIASHCNPGGDGTPTNTIQDSVPGNGVMEILLEKYPQGAQCPDPQGRLPINIALASGKTWETGIEMLVKACPYFILSGTRDIPTGLFCFLLAAVFVERGEQSKAFRVQRHVSKLISAGHGGVTSSCWRFLPSNTKERVLKDAEAHVDILQLNTVFELLRTMPEAIRCGI